MRPSALKHHMLVHRERPTFPCSECDEVFAQEHLLKQHFNMSHVRKTPHQCPICFKYYKKSWHMTQHMEYHAKSFQCPICGHRCGKNSLLKRHMNKHSGEYILTFKKREISLCSKFQMKGISLVTCAIKW